MLVPCLSACYKMELKSMNEILGILAPCCLLLAGFGVLGFLILRDRRERLQEGSSRIVVDIREKSKS